MVVSKILLTIILLSSCWALAPGEKDNENLNNIDDLEEETFSSDFMENFDQLVESVDLLEREFELLWKIALMLVKNLSTHKLSTPAGENSNTNLKVLDVNRPKDRLLESCFQVDNFKSEFYRIKSQSCDLKPENEGWTVIQRRQDGSVDFYRNWTEYVQGFGDISGEFFIGLEKLHIITTQQNISHELYIILEDFEGEQRYACYQMFKIDSKETDYKLTVGNYTGNAGDSLTYHNGEKFSTWDRDPSNCAETYKGAWWHKSCYTSNLNGKYLMGKLRNPKSGQGMSWNSFRGYDYSLKFVQMMIRPHNE